MMERCNFIGMEREAIYVEIATARINYWMGVAANANAASKLN
jgi:DNA modification methylase